MRMMAMRLKLMDEIFHHSSGCVAARVLRPSAVMPSARRRIHGGTSARSRLDTYQSTAPATKVTMPIQSYMRGM